MTDFDTVTHNIKPFSNEDIRSALRFGIRVDQVCDAAFDSGVEDELVLDLLVDAKEALLSFLEAERDLFGYLDGTVDKVSATLRSEVRR